MGFIQGLQNLIQGGENAFGINTPGHGSVYNAVQQQVAPVKNFVQQNIQQPAIQEFRSGVGFVRQIPQSVQQYDINPIRQAAGIFQTPQASQVFTSRVSPQLQQQAQQSYQSPGLETLKALPQIVPNAMKEVGVNLAQSFPRMGAALYQTATNQKTPFVPDTPFSKAIFGTTPITSGQTGAASTYLQKKGVNPTLAKSIGVAGVAGETALNFAGLGEDVPAIQDASAAIAATKDPAIVGSVLDKTGIQSTPEFNAHLAQNTNTPKAVTDAVGQYMKDTGQLVQNAQGKWVQVVKGQSVETPPTTSPSETPTTKSLAPAEANTPRVTETQGRAQLTGQAAQTPTVKLTGINANSPSNIPPSQAALRANPTRVYTDAAEAGQAKTIQPDETPIKYTPDTSKLKDIAEPTGMVAKIRSYMNPIKNMPPDVQAIYTDWAKAHIGAGQQGVSEAIKINQLAKNEGITTPAQVQDFIDKFQQGKTTGPLTDYLTQTNKDILDKEQLAGFHYDPTENYIHQTYVKDPQTPSTGTSVQTGLGAAKARTFPSYAEARAAGFKPRFNTVGEVMGQRVINSERAMAGQNLVNNLESSGYLATNDKAAPGWKEITTNGFPRDSYGAPYRAPAPLANVLNGALGHSESIASNIARAVATTNKLAQHLMLNAGIPNTPINGHIVGQLVKEVVTGKLGVISEFFRSFSSNLTLRNATQNQELISELANRGITFGFDTGLKPVDQADSLVKSIWNKVFSNDATFKRFFPNMQLRTASQTFEAGVKAGLSKSDAYDLAANVMTNYYGLSKDLLKARPEDVGNVLSGVAFAPPFREAYLGFFKNTADAFNPKNWTNPAYKLNRQFVLGAAATLFVMNELNKKLNNGKGMADNAPGRTLYLKIPYGNGKILYIPYLPSIATMPRNLIGAVDAAAHGDWHTAGQDIASFGAALPQLAGNVISNRDYYGNEIYDASQSTAGKLKSVGAYVAGQISPWIESVVTYLKQEGEPNTTKTNAALQAISVGTGSPVKFSSTASEAATNYFTAQSKLTAGLSVADMNTYNVLHPQKDISGNPVIKGPLSTQQTAALYLDHPNLMAIDKQLNQSQPNHDPLWDQPLSYIKQVFEAETTTSPVKTGDLKGFYNTPQYTSLTTARNNFYNSLPSTTATATQQSATALQAADPSLTAAQATTQAKRISLGLSSTAPSSSSTYTPSAKGPSLTKGALKVKTGGGRVAKGKLLKLPAMPKLKTTTTKNAIPKVSLKLASSTFKPVGLKPGRSTRGNKGLRLRRSPALQA